MTLDDFSQLVRTRRSQLVVDQEREVNVDIIRQLCTLATWAPNHQQTWPWAFSVFTGESRRALSNATAEAMLINGDTEMKVAKTRTKYLRAPVVVVVGAQPGESSLQTAENRDAVAAGIQNMLLGATAVGLASFWSSCPKGCNDMVAAHCGFGAGTHVSAMIYFGWPTKTLAAIERPIPNISYFD